MSFPSTPINGQQITLNGILYQYSNVDQTWTKVSTSIVGPTAFASFATHGQPYVNADAPSDTLVINSGPGISITTDPINGVVTISNTRGDANTGGGTDIPVIVNSFTGNGSQNTYTLSTTPGNKDQTLVIVGGIPQSKNTYSLTGTTLTFSESPGNNYSIEVIIFAQSTTQGTAISNGKSIALAMIFG